MFTNKNPTDLDYERWEYDGTRECDECGRVTEAGEFPDWVNGKCEDCDPDIWDHHDNVIRMQDAD